MTVKHETPSDKSNQSITDKCWKLLIYWFEILQAFDLNECVLEQQDFPGQYVTHHIM